VTHPALLPPFPPFRRANLDKNRTKFKQVALRNRQLYPPTSAAMRTPVGCVCQQNTKHTLSLLFFFSHRKYNILNYNLPVLSQRKSAVLKDCSSSGNIVDIVQMLSESLAELQQQDTNL